MATETIYLEKCANCNSKNLTLEFGTSGQLVCQECGMIGYTQQYSTQDIDELATMLQNVTTTEQQNMEEELPKAIREIFKLTVSLGGTISGEHGIGYVQKQYMDIAFTDVELNLMKGIKKVFDPKGILNPGKIFA